MSDMNDFQTKLHLASPFEFTHVQYLFEGRFNRTSQTIHKEMQINCAKHTFSFEFNEKTNQKFMEICQYMINCHDKLPFFLPILFLIEQNIDTKIAPAILTKYYENKSLKDIISRQYNGEYINGWDISHKIAFIYCLSCFLDKLHQNNQFHGRFKASNIIINDNFYPLVSDLLFCQLYDKKEEKEIDYLVSCAPELLKKRNYSKQSDIYSLGIIALQIFQQKINIFTNDNIASIKSEIKNCDFEENLSILPDSIRSIIKKCLSKSPNDRPNASQVKLYFEDVLSKDEHSKSFSLLQKYINSQSEDADENLRLDANKGNLDSMFKYATKLKEKNLNKSLLYIRCAAKQNHTASKELYQSICKKLQPKIEKNQKTNEEDQAKPFNFIRLIKDKFFAKDEIDKDQIDKDVSSHYNNEELFDEEKLFNEEKLRKKGFILTKGAKSRLKKICRYLKEGVPVLLEGPTGTSKTKSAEIVCEMLQTCLYKYNLSSETKTGDLLGRYVGDPNSWSGIKMHKGSFLKAFEQKVIEDQKEKYCVLLLDEINLANQECLHFIEEALDSDEISTEIPGMPWRCIKKDPRFRLIATQNPNKGLFSHKRQDLGLKFLSRFQVVNFPKLDNDELKAIALGLSKVEDFKYKEDTQIIEDLVDFHVEWSERPEIKDDVQCFTVREIEATIHALCGEDACNPYDAVMTIYGARYQKDKKKLLIKTLLSKESFKKYKETSNSNKDDFEYIFSKYNFPNCYHNKNLSDALCSVFFSFNMNRHVILAGEEGCGLTMIARLIAKCRNDDESKESICICTEETKVSDLIGGQKASETKEKSNFTIKWNDGFLCKAIKNGDCAILDSIDEATSTVTERINPLLDIKKGSQKNTFAVPENPNDPEIEINKNFRLLCTCKIDKINQMSPAFINRFDVIVLENQLEGIDQDDLFKLIKILIKDSLKSINRQRNVQINQESKHDSESSDSDNCFIVLSSEDDSHSEDECINNNDDNNESSDYDNSDNLDNNDDNENEYSDDQNDDNNTITNELVDHIYRKLDIKNLPTLQNISQFSKAVAKYKLFFTNSDDITTEEIVDFSYKMLQKNIDFEKDEIPQKMIDYLLNNLKNKDTELNGQFIYKDSEILQTFIAKLYAASIINLPVCVYGPTGVGKTSAAEQFAKERSLKGFQKHSFHAGTKPNHFYATTTIHNKKVSLKKGSLTVAMTNGQVFIADEMNLSSISNMKSLAPALEPSIGDKIFIPGIGEMITVDPNFFFIACQNEQGTLGRNTIPSSIASRFRYFDYPELNENEIKELCFQKRLLLYKKGGVKKLPDDFEKNSKNLGSFMVALNNLKQRIIPKWSFRDITKIFLRVYQQDSNPAKYKKIKFYHQVLFYSISVANEEDSAIILETICDLIKNNFKISDDQRTELIKCYKAKPHVKDKFIMKGDCGVIGTKKEINLPKPLLNALFMVKLSHLSEPIIFMGQSGYKTFISKLIINRANIITLNQESTNAQLLGKSYPFTKAEAKLFYLETLVKILNINNDDLSKLKDLLLQNKLSIDEFIPYIISDPQKNKKKLLQDFKNDKTNHADFFDTIFNSYLKKPLPESFRYAFINLSTKLFTQNEIDNDNIISNYVFEFKPGLFLTSILEGKSLILKNLSNLPTIVFERFNELFSGEHCLSLQEDINNTFTDEKTNRKLTKFNENFRVFATCPPNSISQLSEAVLSRFTVIYTHQYKPEDQKKVLYNLENLKVDNVLIDYVIKFSKQMNDEHSIRNPIPFRQMINIIEMCSNLITEQDSNDQLDILKVVLYRVILGLLEKRDRFKGRLREKINKIFEKVGLQLPEKLTSVLINENPFIIESVNGCNVVKSNLSNITIESPTSKNIKKNYSYTKPFIELLDAIYLGIASKTPVILEGVPGQGKQTALKHVADTLGYKIINIVISQSTKADDLLGKLSISNDAKHNIQISVIKTKLIEALESQDKADSSIIVFHNINHASSAVLEVLQTIFDPHAKSICLTDGTVSKKAKLNIVGIYNQQNGYSNRGYLPSSLIYSSLYYIVNNPTSSELKSIIKSLFENEKFHDDWKDFYLCFIKTNKFAKDNNTSSILTLNDVVKYILFRKKTFSKIDKDVISQMIFAYRFINEKTIQSVKDEIKVKDMNFTPTFTYNFKKKKLNINVKSDQSNELKEGINIELYSKNIDQNEVESKISCLTLPQKHCLLFLACSVLSKRSCILQGATSSGKSHIIRLFAKMLGQDLIVYQMNKDTGISILTGQPTLLSTLNNEDIDKIKELFIKISIIPFIKEYLDNIFYPKKPNDWKLTEFFGLIDFLEKNKNKIGQNDIGFINDAVNDIKHIIRQENRFSHHESAFIKAMKEGKWVLIDGIESAPPEIAQKITSLCGDDPELHLIESGKDNYFTIKKDNNAQTINDKFHLFVTYNPSSQKENISLDPSFFNKCVSFTLPPIDSNAEYSAQVLHGSLLQMSYPNDIAIQISAKMSKSHEVAKEKSINNNDLFAGDLQFTGRTLKFITTEFDLHSQENENLLHDIYKPVCNSFHSFYWNSEIKNDDDLKNEMIDAFLKPADINIVTNLNHKSDDPRIRNKEVLKILLITQQHTCKNVGESAIQPDFIGKCRNIILSDVPFIAKHIEDTLSIMSEQPGMLINYSQSDYPQLHNIQTIMKEISKFIPNVSNELKDVQLNNKDLLNDKQIGNPLIKLQFLEKMQNGKCINMQMPCIFYDSKLFELFRIVVDMSDNLQLKDFRKFVSSISENQNLIPLIESIFPYNLFNDTPFHTINYYLPMFLKLYEKKITFHVKIKSKKFDFKNDHSMFSPTYVFNQKSPDDDLLFYHGTVLAIRQSNEKGKNENNSHKKSSHKKDSHKKDKHKKSNKEKANLSYIISDDVPEDKLQKKVYEVYGLTEYILSNDIKCIDLKEKKKTIHGKIPYPKEYQKSKLAFLFSKSSYNCSMVANIWSLIFSMPDNSSEIYQKYLHPLENDIFKFLTKQFDELDKNSIDNIFALTKWMNKNDSNDDILFGSEKSYLWKILDNTFTIDDQLGENQLNEEIKMIQDEIDYLNSTPTISGWTTKGYIDLIEKNALDPYEKKLKIVISSNQEKAIRSQLFDLLKKINEIKPTKPGHKEFQKHFIQTINKIADDSPTQELFIKCEANYNAFIEQLKSDSSYSKDYFNWPLLPTSTSQKMNITPDTIKLYQHIIWYSKAYSIIDEIDSSNEADIIKHILNLSEIPDMQAVSKCLINMICNEKQSEENATHNFYIKILKSTLNAQFIMRILKDKLTSKINELSKILNDLEERKSDEKEMLWMNQIVNDYPLNLQIVLPKFYANDIFSLFVCYEDSKTVTNGPLTQYILNQKASFSLQENNPLVKSMNDFLNYEMTDETPKFTEYALLVCNKIHNFITESIIKYTNKKEFLDYIKEEENKIKNIQNDKSISEKEKKKKAKILDVFSYFPFIFSVAEKLATCPKFLFTFNDTKFLKKNWLLDTEFVNKYPSLLYWLSLNDNCLFQFQQKFGHIEFSDQKLPFWLFALRILSSQKCIKFHCTSQSNLAKMIKKIINDKCFEEIKENHEIGTNWVNFLLPSVPSEIYNKNYKILYQFLTNLLQDKSNNIASINEKKVNEIKLFTEKVTNIVFKNSLDDLFEKSFNDKKNEDLLKFIFDPGDKIRAEKLKSNKLLLDKFVNDKEFTELKECINITQKELNPFIEKLQKQCEIENNKIDEEYQEIRESDYSLICNEIYESIYEYNDLLSEIVKNKSDPKTFSNKCRKLKELSLNYYLKQIDSSNNTPALYVNAVSFLFATQKAKLQFAFENNIKRPFIFQNPTSINGIQFMYFKNDNYTLEELEKSKLETYGVLNDPSTWKQIDKKVYNDYFYFYQLDDPKIYEICDKESSNRENNPYLIFGKHFILDEFIKELQYGINSKLNQLTSTIEYDFTKKKFNILEKLAQIKKLMDDLISIMCVKYSVDYQNDLNDITSLINNFKKKFVQINAYISNLQKKAKDYSIIQKYNEAISISKYSFFNSYFEIPFPSTNSINFDKSIFSTLKNCDFLSSPFISLENEDSIICCFEKLNCSIGPIIPSLYSGSISLNFISFIDHPITITVKTHDEKYSSWLHSSTFKPKDIAQIYLTLPNSESEESETHDVEADIIISSPGLKSLNLESIFHIIIIPQKIFFYCAEFPIYYKGNNKMLLCTNCLISNSNLNFKVQNFNIKEKLNYKVQFESLDENTSAKPTKSFDYDNDNLQISLPNVETPTRIHCSINMKFSEKLTTKLIIDSIIYPFDFSLLVYDYNQKMYVDNPTIYYSRNYLDRVIKLNMKIISPIFSIFKENQSISFKGFLHCYFSPYIEVLQISLGENFVIHENTNFEIQIRIKDGFYINYNNSISVKINNIEEKINLKFIQPDSTIYYYGESLLKLAQKNDFYQGKSSNGKWEKIYDETNLGNLVAICSPFSKNVLQKVIINYKDGDCFIENNETNMFVYFDVENNIATYEYDTKSQIKSGFVFSKCIPIFGIFSGQWYPVFNQYSPDICNWNVLDINENSKTQAQNDMKQLHSIFGKFSRNGNDFMNFAIRITNFKNLTVIKSILNDPNYSCFKNNLNCSDQILDQINLCTKENEIIICHNVIKLLHTAFSEKFILIKENDYDIISVSLNKEINDKINELYNQYCQIEQDDESLAIDTENEKLFKQAPMTKLEELPSEDEQKQAYIISSHPTPTTRDALPEIISISAKGDNSYSSKNIEINLHDINPPSYSQRKEYSINKMNDFYSACLKGTRILPIFVKNIIAEKNEENIATAFNYFVLLYNAYRCLPISDKSIISQATNDFRFSFCSMIGKFSKAGMEVSKFINKKNIIDVETSQDFISYPNIESLYHLSDIWNIKTQESNNSLFSPMTTTFDGAYIGESREQNNDTHILDLLDQNKSKPSNFVDGKVIDENSHPEYQPIYFPDTDKNLDDKNDIENDDDDDDESSDDSEHYDDTNNNKKVINRMRVTLDRETVELSEKNLDGILSNFSEYDSIKASIFLMKEMNELSEIKINKSNSVQIEQQLLDPPENANVNDLPIQPLIKQSLALTQQLIIAISNHQIPFSQLCANILVDCSCFISIENKLFNMLLICALTNALDILTIPYSVAVFGDSNFKCVIKKFEEKHSAISLQKILDCIFIKRFYSNLPTAIRFGIDNMEHDSLKQRVIFTFTSGLDEQIRLTKSWAETIFDNEELSFLFVFIKSVILNEQDSDFLQSVWANFESQSKEYKARSIVKVAQINAQVSNFDYFVNSFVQVLTRNISVEDNASSYANPLFTINNSLQNADIFMKLIDDENKMIFAENNKVYIETTDVLQEVTSKINKLDSMIYRNQLSQIIQLHSEKKNEHLDSLLKRFIENRIKINQSTLETIFKPNKASQTILSNTGSDIDVTALILNIINPVPDPMIYLEEKGGLIRNYGISVIIDPSASCFFNLSAAHTLLTIRTVLSSFAALDIPCFDLIVAGNPQPTVLCSEVGTMHSLDHKSNIWEPLFSLLERLVPKADLASAISAAYDLRRMRSKDYTSFLFVITDGLYEKSERSRILQIVNNMVQSGTSVFGIGVGSYPKGIEELFPQVIFSPNPLIVMKCVASFYGYSVSGRLDKMPTIYPKEISIDDVINLYENLKISEDKPIFADLKEKLSKIKHLLDAFHHCSNEEGSIYREGKGFVNVEGENTEMYKKDIFASQKILIVMLWDYSMNTKHEKEELQVKYIFENFEPGKKECIKTAVEHFGITIEVVQNYKDAIEKLLHQEKDGYCDYYAVWVMCGPPIGKLPDNNTYTNLCGQFIEVITQFWKNGGALIFWAEGKPLFYQVNEFLKMNGFQFQLEGSHKGYQTLSPDESNDLKRMQTFNRHPQGNETNDRKTLAYNLGKIFEGVTISFVNYDLEKIRPFIPFSRDSEGGISSMFLPADRNKGTGDIVIDCGYTKCFANLTEDGTYRYIQNIAGWTMNMESHYVDGFKPKEWRPKAVNYSIKLNAIYNYPNYNSNKVDVVFCIDATGSMGSWLSAAKERSQDISNASRSKYPHVSFHFGAIFYRDPIDSTSDTNDYFQPTEDIPSLINFMTPQKPEGGRDTSEDWVGAYTILLKKISWRNDASRAIIHIADAPAHGSDWGGVGEHEDQNNLLHPLIHECAKLNIFFSGINVNSGAQESFNKIKQIYISEEKGNIFNVTSIENVNSSMAGDFLQNTTSILLDKISAFESF